MERVLVIKSPTENQGGAIPYDASEMLGAPLENWNAMKEPPKGHLNSHQWVHWMVAIVRNAITKRPPEHVEKLHLEDDGVLLKLWNSLDESREDTKRPKEVSTIIEKVNTTLKKASELQNKTKLKAALTAIGNLAKPLISSPEIINEVHLPRLEVQTDDITFCADQFVELPDGTLIDGETAGQIWEEQNLDPNKATLDELINALIKTAESEDAPTEEVELPERAPSSAA